MYLQQKFMRAMLFGVLLCTLALISAAVSVAFIKYYRQPEVALIFPLMGVMSMFVGEKLLYKIEQTVSNNTGGAGASFFRCAVSAIVIVSTPAIAWGSVEYVSNLIVVGFETWGMPHNTEFIRNLLDRQTG